MPKISIRLRSLGDINNELICLLTRLRGIHWRMNCRVDGGTLRTSRTNAAINAVLGLMDLSDKMFSIRRNSRTVAQPLDLIETVNK